MKRSDLCGVYTASVTPVNADRTLDVGAVKALMDYYYTSGLSGAFFPSSSGDYFSMTAAMKKQCAQEAVKAAAGRMAIFGNISDHCPEVTYENARIMADAGVDAVLCMPPQMHGFSQEEILTYYYEVADRSPVPVIAYNHMLRMPTVLEIPTVVALSRHANIIGVKDTHRDQERPALLRKALDEAHADLVIMAGGDGTAGAAALAGMELLNALSAVRPDLMLAIRKAGHAGDAETVHALQEKVFKLFKLFTCLRGGISSSTLFTMALKICLERRGLCGTQSVILGFKATDEDRKIVYDILDSVD